jgi:predicted nucleotidyltransferase
MRAFCGRGTAGPARDVDLGVVLDGSGPAPAAIAVALERVLHRTVDVVLMADAPPLLRSEISRHGVLLVERQPYAWADFRAQAMIDWGDWAPTAEQVRRTIAARLREEVPDGSS